MSKYLFIETRDPFDSTDVKQTWDLAVDLSKAGSEVAYFLVQNGVFATREGAKTPVLEGGNGITVYADDLSLRERGIAEGALRSGVTVAGADKLTDLIMEDGRKPVWT